MKKDSKIISKPNPWVLSIGSGFVLYLLTSVITSLKIKINFFESIKLVGKKIGWFFVTVLSFRIAVWMILLGFGILIGVLFIIIKIQDSNSNVRIDERPDFLSYKSDIFPGNLKWIWDYQKNNIDGQYHIVNLRPVCANCETPLMLSDSFHSLEAHCPRCKNSYSQKAFYNYNQQYYLDHPNEVKSIIIDNIKRKEQKLD